MACAVEELHLAGNDEQAYNALNESLAKQIMVIVGKMVKRYGGTVEWNEKRLNSLFKEGLDALLEEYTPKYIRLSGEVFQNALQMRNIRLWLKLWIFSA